MLGVPRYDVGFDVNGTVYELTVEDVKIGNRYLHLKDDTTQKDGATVAMVPFDAIEYILSENRSLSTSSVGATAGDGLSVADLPGRGPAPD
ncbi:MAG: hypothetical protein ABEJ42_10570 [Halobacteriaceae archaeon]